MAETEGKKKTWIIWHDIGFGREQEVIEAASEDEASKEAYEAFAQACESAFNWGCEEVSADTGTADVEADEDDGEVCE